MHNVSSEKTVFYKIFLPVIWIVFFGTLFVYILLSDEVAERLAAGGGVYRLRISFLFFYFTGIAMFLVFFMNLKRVEMDADFVYVTNYFKIYKYPYHNVEKIQRGRFLFFRPTAVYFKKSGSFGKKVRFLASRQFDEFVEKHSEVKALVEY